MKDPALPVEEDDADSMNMLNTSNLCTVEVIIMHNIGPHTVLYCNEMWNSVR